MSKPKQNGGEWVVDQVRQDKIEKEARKLALAFLNANREAAGLAPLAKLERLYWSIHKAEWIAKATAAQPSSNQ